MDSPNNIVEGFVRNLLPATTPARRGILSETNIQPRPDFAGCLIINADDWGYDAQTTDRTLDCFEHRALSSASGMVFMQDSGRAAGIAAERGLDIALHLNLSVPFSAPGIPARLANHHQKVRAYLRSGRFAQLLYHPGLTNSFEYVVARQLEEFVRLYGRTPDRIDGHHHMHLCANVLMGRLLPEGTIVRRSFSFFAGEKSLANRSWRTIVNSILARRHRLADFFFSLPPLTPGRLQAILLLASKSVVEVETHPVNCDEYAFLTSGGISKWSDTVEFSSFSRYFN